MLQRRRRKSNPPSPSSPTSTRRPLDKPEDSVYVSSPVEPSSALSQNSESQAFEVTVPSPVCHQSSFSGSLPTRGNAKNSVPRQGRTSDEYVRHRRQPSWEGARHSANTGFTAHAPGAAFPPPASASNSSSATNNLGWPPFERQGDGRYSLESRNRFYEEHTASQRNYNLSSVASERSLYDEGGTSKNQVHKKSRLNLLNAMNLLSRRRTSHTGKDGGHGLTINTSGVAPLDTSSDVSIRGNKVHDFSAPRPRRLLSLDTSSGDNSPLIEGQSSMPEDRQSCERSHLSSSPAPPRRAESPKHSPLFKEHFDEDRSSLQPAQTAYLHSLANSRNIRGDRMSSNPPAFAKRLPFLIPGDGDPVTFAESSLDDFHLPNQTQNLPSHLLSKGTPEPPSSPPAPLPPAKGQPSPELNLPASSALPRHMTSTSSRFSFQLGNYDSSAQEKLLEEKHKQQQASKKLAVIDADDEPEEDSYDNYDFESDDGLEEKIPGVNADWDEEDFEDIRPGTNTEEDKESRDVGSSEDKAGRPQIDEPDDNYQSHFMPVMVDFDASQSHSATETIPRELDSIRIGTADSKHISAKDLCSPHQSGKHAGIEGLGISTHATQLELDKDASSETKVRTVHSFVDEDLYFDDGDFDEDSLQHDEAYDESLFDNGLGNIRDIPAENAGKFQAAWNLAAYRPVSSSLDRATTKTSEKEGHEPQTDVGIELPSIGECSYRSSSAHGVVTSGTPSNSISLTEGNLAAYHDALVLATNEAAANGRFDRSVTFSHLPDDIRSLSQIDESQSGLTTDVSRPRHDLGNSSLNEDDGLGFDEDYDDDLMIAEANAEALENDDEGFYGSEFGFFARAQGKGNSEPANGGYFAARGSNGVKRSHSGKANFQEPSLTPITEISEWSNRNSVSLQIPLISASTGSIQSPAMAQLLEQDSSDLDDALSMSKLMKFRREAFGGSSMGINGHGASHNTSSPHIHIPSHMASSYIDHGVWSPTSVHNLPGSLEIPESEEEDDEDTGLPTLTQSTPHKKLSDPSPLTPQSQTAICPSFGGLWERSKISHSRTSSGAESVSYVKDPQGSDRWVLERRRTGDSGEIEVVGREYLPGARI